MPYLRFVSRAFAEVLRREHSPRRSKRAALTLLSYDDRIVPAVHTWTNANHTGVWSDALNWTGGVPTTGESGGTVCVFGTVATQLTSTQNIPGLVVDQIQFKSNPGSVISLTAQNLGLDGANLVSNITDSTGGTDTITGTGAGQGLVLSGATAGMNVNAGSVLTVASNVTGSVGLVAQGVGTLDLYGSTTNTYSGTTTVLSGTLQLNKSVGVGVPGNLVIGDGTGAAGSAVVLEMNSSDVAGTSAVTINNDGLFDLNGHTDVVASLASNPGPSTSQVSLGNGTLTVGDATNSTFAGVVSGAGGNFIKAGSGTLNLSGSAGNGFTATTTIRGGTVQLTTATGTASLTLTGRTLDASGTAGNDSFAFAAGAAKHQIVLNGVKLAAFVADVDAVAFHGGGGTDAADLTGIGTKNAAGLSPTYGELAGTGYHVSVDAVASVTAHGGATDAAYFGGSSGGDSFTANGAGAAAALTGTINNAPYSNTASGFGTVAAFAGNGTDAAFLAGTTGNETFAGTPTYAELAGGGYDDFAVGFDTVTAFGGGGSDAAYLAGSVGNDDLAASPTAATLSGSGFSNTASGFAATVSYSGGGSDAATLSDSAGNVVFVGTPTYSEVAGAGYANYAVGFAAVTASGAAGGADAAYLVDSAGDDTLTASGSTASVSAPTTSTPAVTAYSVTVTGMDFVVAYGTNGGTNKKTVGTLNYQLFTEGY